MILRTCVCIPVYDNPATIAQVVRDCLERTRLPILVVDDGSATPVEALLGGLDPTRVRVLRLVRNSGKGMAIQAAIDECVRQGYTHLLTMDGDGQHLASEIPKLMELARMHPWDLIIGYRGLQGENVPGASRFGRSFSNFWVGYQTGLAVTDSQSGMRLYPLFHLQTLRFWTRRYDFEIEVLIRLLWKGVGVHEVPIEVFYPLRAERVSHFDKLRDNARISCLNTALVALSLFRTNRSPAKLALALGLGVLVGCTPLYGLHSAIAGLVALVFRLGFVPLWLGTQISIPPLAPVLLAGSLALGNAVTGGHVSRWEQCAVGSLALGACLGGITGLAAWGIARRRQPQRIHDAAGPSNWSGKVRGGRFGNWFLKTVATRLGLGAAYFCLYFIIPYFYLFAPRARRAASEYWKIVRPGAGWFERQWLIHRQLFQFGRLLLDRVYQGTSPEPCFQSRPEGIEHILQAVDSRQGAILLSAHMGGWDMASALLKNDGLSGEFHRVQYESNDLTFSKVLGDAARENLLTLQPGAPIQSQASPPILMIRQLLEQGKPVGLMGDRPLGGHFELVRLFGKLAPLDITAFRIAAATEAPLLFTFGFKGSGQEYRFHATPSRVYRYSRDADKGLQCLGWAQEYADALEKMLERYPDQWSNFFPLWSALPSLPPGVESPRRPNYGVEDLLAGNGPR